MSVQTEAGRRGLPAVVRVLVVARAVNRLGAFTLPFLAVVLTLELGASVAQSGLILALFGFLTIPSRILGGQLADRLGSKRTIIGGLCGCAVAQLWIAGSQSLWSAVLAVALLGMVFEIYEPPSQAIIADVTDPADRPAAYSLLGAAMAAAGIVAGLLATWLSDWDLRLLFVVDATTCLACAGLVAATLPTKPHTSNPPQHPVGRSAWRDPRLLLMLAIGTVFATVAMELVMGLPLTLIHRGLPSSAVGVVLTISAVTMVALQFLGVRRLSRYDDFRVLAVGCLLLAIGSGMNGFATNLLAFGIATVIWSIGDLLLLGRLLSIVAGLAPERSRGRYLAAYGISWGIATAVAPLAGTQLLKVGGPVALWGSCAIAALALAAAQPAVRRRVRGDRREVQGLGG